MSSPIDPLASQYASNDCSLYPTDDIRKFDREIIVPNDRSNILFIKESPIGDSLINRMFDLSLGTIISITYCANLFGIKKK
jgi:hypothetical protein